MIKKIHKHIVNVLDDIEFLLGSLILAPLFGFIYLCLGRNNSTWGGDMQSNEEKAERVKMLKDQIYNSNKREQTYPLYYE